VPCHGMAEKLVVRVSGSDRREEPPCASSSSSSYSFSEFTLTLCLQFIGCKPRRSQKASRKVFWLLAERERSTAPGDPSVAARQAHLTVSREDFEAVVISCLGEHPRHLPDAQTKLDYFRTASRVVVEKTETLIILLCGTTGSGKSTLASLVASRLGIAHVMSTDVIRNLLRGLDGDKAREYLWKSTYEEDVTDVYVAQREAILERAGMLVDSFVDKRKESLIIEGVHLSGEFAVRMMERHPRACILPFLVYISNEEKHLERFAVRAKAMTLRPDSNRYVKHLSSIRSIQGMLIEEANTMRIPQVDNTNVDRSLAAIHETVLAALEAGAGPTAMERIAVISDIFAAKNRGRSGKDAEARIKALNDRGDRGDRGDRPAGVQARGMPAPPLSSSTSAFTLRGPSTVDGSPGLGHGSDENDSEYDEVDRPVAHGGHGHGQEKDHDNDQASVRDELTTTLGLSGRSYRTPSEPWA